MDVVVELPAVSVIVRLLASGVQSAKPANPVEPSKNNVIMAEPGPVASVALKL